MAKKEVQVKFSLVDGITGGLQKITGALGEIGKSVLKLTGVAAAATAALGAIGGALTFRDSIAAAATFEKALDRIKAATGATDAELARIKASIEETAAGAAKGVDEAAAAFETLAREGFTTAEAINTLPAALAFATAAQLETAEAAGILADTLDQYGIAAADASRITDTLAAAALKGGTDIGGLTGSLREVAPVARTLGVGIEQAAAALGLLAQNGIEGRKAGGALRLILADLADPTSKFRAELVKLGITSTDFGTVVEQLAARGQGAQAALQALGDRAGPALAAILRQGAPALREFVGSLKDSEGAAANAAAIINDNLLTAFRQLQNAVLDVGRQFLEPLLGPLTDEVQAAEKAIREFAESKAFKDLSQAFSDVFIAGVQGVKQFIAEFDFTEASKQFQKFASDTSTKASELAEDIGKIADGLRTISDVVGGTVDVFKAAGNQAIALGADVVKVGADLGRVASELSGGVADEFEDVAESMASISEAANEASGEALGSLVERFDDVKVAAVDVDAALAPVPGKLVTLTTSAAELEQEFAGTTAAVAATGDAVARTGQQAGTASQQIVRLAAELAELQNEITRQQAAGADGTVLAPLIEAADKFEQRLKAAKDAASAASTAVQTGAAPAAAALNETSTAAQQTAASLEQVGTASQQAGADAAEGATQTAGAASELFGLINALAQKYKGVSDGALEFFLAALKSTSRAVTSLEAFGEAIERADKATVAALANQKTQAEAIGKTLQTFADTGVDAFGRVGRNVGYTVEQLDAMIVAAREGRSGFELLDKASLAGIIAQAEAARERVLALAEAARSARDELAEINRQLQDDADRAAGNEEAIAERELQAKIARIRELARAGGAEAQLEAARAERLANEAYQRELARIRQLREEQRKSSDEYVANKERERAADGQSAGAAGGVTRPTPAPDPAQPARPTTLSTINVNVNGPVVGTLDRTAVENLGRQLQPELTRLANLRR